MVNPKSSEGQSQAQGQGQEKSQPQAQSQREPAQQFTHFEKLVAAGSEAERNIKFDTEAKLKKYGEDVRTVNNLTVDDPMRYQQEHGVFPKRGNSMEFDVVMKGLSKQDRIDVTAGRKSLEVVDKDKGTFRAV